MQHEVVAAPEWRCIDFISDLHLAADTPATFQAWEEYLRATAADAVFILGDLFEVWVGDDSRFEGFDAECMSVLGDATRRCKVFFMVGNRDFLVGAQMLADCRVTPLHDPCTLTAFDQRSLLTHGDALCLGDTEYQAFRWMVRDTSWQTQFLAQPLEARRLFAREARTQSEMRKIGHASPSDWVDIDKPEAQRWLAAASAKTLIHGHTHRPATEELGSGDLRQVLSDWDLDHSPHRAEVLRLTAEGFTRVSPKDAHLE